MFLKEFRKIAHRGLHDAKVPENSMTSFAKAIEANYAIELDVHLTKDNMVVVFHDNNLLRMTGVSKAIEECTYKELMTYRLKGTEEKIPLFKDVLRQVNGAVGLLIEIKNSGVPGKLEKELIRLLKKYKGIYMVQSFNALSLIYMKKNAPNIIRGKLAAKSKCKFTDKLMEWFLMVEVKPQFIAYKLEDVNVALINHCKLRRLPLYVWTVRREEDYLKIKKKCKGVIFENIKI